VRQLGRYLRGARVSSWLAAVLTDVLSKCRLTERSVNGRTRALPDRTGLDETEPRFAGGRPWGRRGANRRHVLSHPMAQHQLAARLGRPPVLGEAPSTPASVAVRRQRHRPLTSHAKRLSARSRVLVGHGEDARARTAVVDSRRAPVSPDVDAGPAEAQGDRVVSARCGDHKLVDAQVVDVVDPGPEPRRSPSAEPPLMRLSAGVSVTALRPPSVPADPRR
jgi:hypothetical protein